MKEKKEVVEEDKDDEEENKGIELRIIRSKIKGKQGVVRINNRHLSEVEFEEGDNAEMLKKGDDSGIIVTVFADRLMKPGTISVREEDMEKMEVEEGEDVVLRSYETYQKKIREGFEHIKEKFKRKKDEDDLDDSSESSGLPGRDRADDEEETEEKGEKEKSSGKKRK